MSTSSGAYELNHDRFRITYINQANTVVDFYIRGIKITYWIFDWCLLLIVFNHRFDDVNQTEMRNNGYNISIVT